MNSSIKSSGEIMKLGIALVVARPYNKRVTFSESIDFIEVDSFKQYNKENNAEPILDIDQESRFCINCSIY